MQLKKKLLIVDDEQLLGELYAEYLQEYFDVLFTTDPDIAYRIATQNEIDALLLDVHLGKNCGLQLCEKLRRNLLTQKIQIFLITGYGNKEILLESYKIGADDYIEKPIDMEELKIRLTGRIRRLENLVGRSTSIGNLKLLPDFKEVEICGKRKALSPIEFSLLKLFLANINKNISRNEILNSIWSNTAVEERTVDVHINSLRKKIQDFDHHIESLYGSGYVLRSHKIQKNNKRLSL